MWPRILRVLFVAYVVAIAVHIGWVVHHEPFGFDAWNVAQDTHAQPITAGRFFDYWWLEYTHSNPRFGQIFAYLGYKLEWFSVYATPLAYLAISLAITMIGVARWPFRRGRDLAMWAFVLGAIWFALPQVGKTLFCRAYCANYIYSLAIQLWFLVPLRLARGSTTMKCIAYALLGLIAGMCNEHTGPTLCVFMLGYAWWEERPPVARLARWGALGAILGFCAIFFAPGQGQRYDALATKVSLFGRLMQRGVTGNVEILRDLLLGVAPVLGLIAITALLAIMMREPENREREGRRTAVRMIVAAMFAAVAMAVTIFVSPKLGPRFYYGSSCILLAGLVALADTVLSNRALVPFVLLSGVAELYAAAHTVPLYGRVMQASEVRMAELAALKPGDVYFAASFEQIDETWWFLGDDFRDPKKRELVSDYFALQGVVFHAYDPLAPLGVAGARFVPSATLEPASCVDEHGGLILGAFKGFDMTALHHEVKTGIELLRKRVAPAVLSELDLGVVLDDPRATLPRKRILVAKWRPDHYESYVGAIERKGRAKTRDIALPKELKNTDFQILAYQVGGETKPLGGTHGEPLQYVPWHSGVYWILACHPEECFVIAASRQGG
ncbi:MAG: DUF6056 family protein [Kofleriaceae bacterium]